MDAIRSPELAAQPQNAQSISDIPAAVIRLCLDDALPRIFFHKPRF